MSFDKYRRRVTARGSNAKDIILNERIQSFNDYLENSISGQEAVIDGKKYLVSVQGVKFHDERSSEAKYLFTNLDTPAGVGSLVEWGGDNWIVLMRETETIQSHLTYYMARCNETLKWQDKDGAIHSLPCILADKTSVYSDGLSKTEHISLGADQVSITIGSYQETEDIPLNKRFMFKNDSNNIYEVSRKDNMLRAGTILFVAKKSLYNPNTDNLELNIADYIAKPYEDETPTIPDIPLDHDTPIEKEELTIWGLERFTVWDKNEEYIVSTGKDVKWSLDREDLIKIVKVDGSKCYISSASTNKIGESALRAEAVDDPAIFTEMVIPKFYQ